MSERPVFYKLVFINHILRSTPVSLLSNVVYNICTRLGLVMAYGTDNYDPLPTNGNFSSLPGGARAEAERRRWVSVCAVGCDMVCADVQFTGTGLWLSKLWTSDWRPRLQLPRHRKQALAHLLLARMGLQTQ